MIPSLTRTQLILGSGLLLGLILLLIWISRPDPKEAFLREVDLWISEAHQGEHSSLRPHFSPEAIALVESQGLSFSQALLLARKMDQDSGARYRVINLSVFYPRDYAEVDFERSRPGGDFNEARRFTVPFIHQQGQWKIAGAFRGEREFVSPY
ncbi:MAG: hypothetical protein HC904_11670 [Blastochloris sp.]|nr:hypothetical protein [Blastochloris sp.]